MKKLITAFLALSLILGLCACGGTEAPEGTTAPASNLQIGFARECITPDTPVPLAGYGNTTKRISTQVLDDIYLTCLAFSDGKNTVLLYTQDLLISTNNWVPNLRATIQFDLGVPSENIMFAATNNHSGPDSRNKDAAMLQFTEKYEAAVLKAATDAMNDLAPAVLYSTTTNTEGMNFVRHYYLTDGSVAGEFYGDFSAAPIDRHTAEPDTEMVLVKADRPEGKKDILLMNYQVHPNLTSGEKKTDLCADFVGPTRDKIEADTGMLCAYFTGATAELDPTSRIESEQHGMDYIAYGQKLAQYAIDALPNMKLLEGDGIKVQRLAYNCAVNHYDEELAAEAERVVALWKETDIDTGNELARELGLSSVFHAEVVAARPSRPDKKPIELNAFSVGGLGFVTAPYKMYSINGKYVKENSPMEATFVLSEANEAWPNIAAKEAYAYGSYESDCSYYAEGMGERLAEIFVDMLELVR